MEAVKADKPWNLVWETVPVQACAPCGICWIGTDLATPNQVSFHRPYQHDVNNSNYSQTIAATNSCGE
jgi:hypothetical protein